MLAVTGDPPEVGDYPGSRGVYEVDAIGLVQLMAHLNRGEDFNGRAIDAATSFHIGVAVNPSADDLDLELERYRQKLDAGAHFAMTQIIFDLEYLDRFLDRSAVSRRSDPRRDLPGLEPPARPAPPQRGAGDHRAGELPGGVARSRPRRAGGGDGDGASDVAGRAAGVYLVAPFRRPLGASSSC